MITFNGVRWARNEKELIETLFDGNGTAVGFYRPTKAAVWLMNLQKERIGVINAYAVLCAARKREDGKYIYSFAPLGKGYKESPYIYRHDSCAKGDEEMDIILRQNNIKRKYSN